jgi:hypothetical protein
VVAGMQIIGSVVRLRDGFDVGPMHRLTRRQRGLPFGQSLPALAAANHWCGGAATVKINISRSIYEQRRRSAGGVSFADHSKDCGFSGPSLERKWSN